MKLVCIDKDNCGYIEYNCEYEETEETITSCPACGYAAGIFSDEYEPLSTQGEDEINYLLLRVYGLLHTAEKIFKNKIDKEPE